MGIFAYAGANDWIIRCLTGGDVFIDNGDLTVVTGNLTVSTGAISGGSASITGAISGDSASITGAISGGSFNWTGTTGVGNIESGKLVPVIAGGNFTTTSAFMTYTRIGDVVNFSGYLSGAFTNNNIQIYITPPIPTTATTNTSAMGTFTGWQTSDSSATNGVNFGLIDLLQLGGSGPYYIRLIGRGAITPGGQSVSIGFSGSYILKNNFCK